MARAGRTGTAYSLVSPDEGAYVVDLHLFLGRNIITDSHTSKERRERERLKEGQIPL